MCYEEEGHSPDWMQKFNLIKAIDRTKNVGALFATR